MCSQVMLGCVLILGIITATDMTAGHAQPQVYPRIAHRQALFATIRAWNDVQDLIAMGAFFSIPAAAPDLFAKRFPGR